MTTTQDHPHFDDEQSYLSDTVGWIDQELDSIAKFLKSLHPRSVQDQNKERQQELTDLRPRPYFGRVDWQSQANGRERWYVGNSRLGNESIQVFSWKDTLVGDLYYQGETEREQGTLLLKRAFEIDEGTLQAIHDQLVHDSIRDELGGVTLSGDGFTDALLIRLLEETRGSRLHDIVATIQAQQYRIIRSPLEQLLIVQGVPGSGKTIMALHRLSYLLYNHSEQLRRVLVLAPNRLFLNYLEGVLPALGDFGIPHRTFNEWVIQHLGENVEFEVQDEMLEALLDPALDPTDRTLRLRNARHKGSLAMGSLLERYVSHLYNNVLRDSPPLSVSIRLRKPDHHQEVVEVQRSVAQLRQFLDDARGLPLNKRRERVESAIAQEMSREVVRRAEQLRIIAPSKLEEFRTHVYKVVEGQVRTYFSEWIAQNVSVAYRRLLRTPELLHELGRELFSPWDLEMMAHTAPTQRTPFHFSDLAGLLYLKLLLDGRDDALYDHIVVDEAQDLTPLHFKVLSQYCRNGSMTILGDLAQGIYHYHGLEKWENLIPAVGEADIHQETLQQSYRATQEIAEFANNLQRCLGVPDENLAVPLARQGQPPMLHKMQERSEMIALIPQLLARAQAEGWRSIAIIGKSLHHCNAINKALAAQGFSEFQFLSERDSLYEGGSVLLPTYLAKGLEFDVVLLVDADNTTYRPEQLDAALLYVAITRAAHCLHICWQGTLSPLLQATPRTLEVTSTVAAHLSHLPRTVADYTVHHPYIKVDWLIERLAATDRLHLLATNGQIDSALLGLLLRDFMGAPSKQILAEDAAQ